MQLSLVGLVTLLAIVQGLFFSVFLFQRKAANPLPNRLFAWFILIFCCASFEDVLFESRLILEYPHFSETLTPLLTALPPLFYFYTIALTSPDFRLRPRHALHFLSALLLYALFIPFYFAGKDEKIAHLLMLYEKPADYYSNTGTALMALYALIYMSIAIRQLYRHATAMENFFSSVEKVDLAWLRQLVFGMCLVTGFWFIVVLFPSPEVYAAFQVVIMAGIYWLAYRFLGQQPIPAEVVAVAASVSAVLSEQNKSKEESKSDAEPSGKKYEKSTLSEELADVYCRRLTDLMASEKAFCNPDLTLPVLAGQVGASPHHVSQILNDRFGKNFFEFVNHYRVEQVKADLVNPKKQHLTILAIAFEAGFNSKNAFNTAFKKSTGITPSAYKKSALSTK